MKVLFVCAFLLATLAVPFMAKVISERERYIILLKEGATDEQIEEVIQMVEGHEASPREELFIESDNTLLPIFFGEISEETANKVSKSLLVEVVEKDEIISINRNMFDLNLPSTEDLEDSFDTRTERYNLDVFGHENCTNGTFNPFNFGLGADIYVLDTGINYDHGDFGWVNGTCGTRAYYGGYDAVDAATASNQRGRDCHGHGTHVAGIAGGKYSGVAKEATIFSIRVLNCSNSGYITWSIKGIIAVTRHHAIRSLWPEFVGSIINLSFGSKKSETVNAHVNAAVSLGIIVVTASGNNGLNACNYSPGTAGLSINVGAHGYVNSTCKKPIGYFSNYGPCVDIIAPGVDIFSAYYRSNTGFIRMSGTSMSCPHVSGLAALMKRANKLLTPADIKARIEANAIDDIDRSTMSPQVRAISTAKRAYLTPNLVA